MDVADKLRAKIAEAYQVIGALADAAGSFDDPAVQAALDHMSDPDAHLDDELLPWLAGARPTASAAILEWAEARRACCENPADARSDSSYRDRLTRLADAEHALVEIAKRIIGG